MLLIKTPPYFYQGFEVWIIIAFGFYARCVSLQQNDIPIEEEFCQWEVFNATCAEGEVIIMRTARYGRMKLGKCLTTDYFVGCSADVLSHIDSRCSGHRTCLVNVPDADLFNVQPCRKDLIAYFSASYDCVKVETGTDSTCSEADRKKYVSVGHLSTQIARERGVGTPGCPWRLQAQTGQTINLTLYDFATWNHAHVTDKLHDNYNNVDYAGPSMQCVSIGTVFENGRTSDIRVCRTRARTSLVYSSRTNKIDVSFIESELISFDTQFLLKFEAVGCAHLKPPQNANVTHQGDIAVVRCNNTARSWHLVCKDTTWMGDIGNCSVDGSSTRHSSKRKASTNQLPFGIMVAVGIGIILGILIGMIFLVSLLLCQRRRKRNKQARAFKESNALLHEPCLYSDRESLGMAYKMIELRHAGQMTPDMTSDIQAVELSGGTQCEACNLSQHFLCDAVDNNIYDVKKLRSAPNTMRTFRASGEPTGTEFPALRPPPAPAFGPAESGDGSKNMEDRCCILDLVPTQSNKSPSKGRNAEMFNSSMPNSSNLISGPGDAAVVSPSGHRDRLPNVNQQSSNNPDAKTGFLPVDLTSPCSPR